MISEYPGRIEELQRKISAMQDDGLPEPDDSFIEALTEMQVYLEEAVACQEAMADREELYRCLVELSPEPLGVLIDGKIAYTNPSGAALFGASSPIAVLGLSIFDLVHEDHHDSIRPLTRGLSREPSDFGEIRLLGLDGSVKEVKLCSSGIIYRGQPASLIVARDISARKKVESDLKSARDAAEAATRAKSDFLAKMSHEIRTPLNAVIGMTSLLLSTEMDDAQRDCIETIRLSGNALVEIINDILDISKIEAGRMDIAVEPFDLRACIEDSMDIVAVSAAEKGLDLAYHLDCPGCLAGDYARLRQVLVNLLSNAVKFTQRGEVSVEVEARPAEGGMSEVHFKVSDTGMGIAPDSIERLFKSFSQADSTIASKYGGTGLGLAICKCLVEMMGGVIWAESSPCLGSKFHFTVMAQAIQTDDCRPRGSSGKHILILGKECTSQRALVEQLRSWDIAPTVSRSAVDALALVDTGWRFDLAVLDLASDGECISFAEEVRRRHIELTLAAMDFLRPRGPLFDSFLAKPVKHSQLTELLDATFCQELVPGTDTGYHVDIPSGSLRVLVAEDDPVNIKVALMMLGRLGYTADTARSGEEVLSSLESQRYDLIFMDVQMPGIDGLEATRRILKLWPGSDRPMIVAMTACALKGDRERCLQAGMDDYIAKPISIGDLREALGRCLCVRKKYDV